MERNFEPRKKQNIVDAETQQQIDAEVAAMFEDKERNERMVKRVDEILEQAIEQGVNVVVFLDKSARPLSWLMKARAEKRGIQMPEVKFMNVGSNSTSAKDTPLFEGVGYSTFGNGVDFRYNPSHEVVRSKILNDEFITTEDGGDVFTKRWEYNGEHSDVLQIFAKEIEGKNVLVIDDIVSSGASLLTAMKILEIEQPGANIQGTSAFFQGPGEERKALLPWSGLNYAGVIESAVPTIFSKRPTPEELQKIERAIYRRTEQEIESADSYLTEVSTVLDSPEGTEIIRQLRLAVDTYDTSRMIDAHDAFERALHAIAQMRAEYNAPDENVSLEQKIDLYTKLYRGIKTDSVAMVFYPLQEAYPYSRSIEGLLTRLYIHAQEITYLQDSKKEIEKPEVYIAKQKALRAAIQHLGAMESGE